MDEIKDIMNMQLADLLESAKTAFPDSHHKDESWTHCWNELSSNAQDYVKEMRALINKVVAEIFDIPIKMVIATPYLYSACVYALEAIEDSELYPLEAIEKLKRAINFAEGKEK